MPLAIERGEAATALSRVLVSAVAAFATEFSVADRFSLFDSAVDVLRANGPSAFADCNDRFRLDPPPSSSAPPVATPSCSRPSSSGGVVLVGRPPCLAGGGGAAARAGDASSGLPLAAVSRGRAPVATTGVGRPPADAGRSAGASSGGAMVVPPPPPPIARLPPLASWADILRRHRSAAPPVLRAVLAPAADVGAPATGLPGAVARRGGGADADDAPWTLVERRRGRGGRRASPQRPGRAPKVRGAFPPPSRDGRVAGAGATVTQAAPATAPVTGAPAAPLSCAAAAVAALTRGRTGAAPLPSLTTLYVAGVSREERSYRLRALVAAAVDVPTAAIVDVDRFGATAEVTVLTSAVAAVGTALASPDVAGVLWEVPGVSPWSPCFLGGRRRAQLTDAEAIVEGATRCIRRLTNKVEQIAERDGMPPPVRAALRGHVARRLALCRAVPGAGPAPRLAGGGAAVLGKARVPAPAASAADAAARGRHPADTTANAPGPEAKILRRTDAPDLGAAAASSVRGANAGMVEGARPDPAAGRPQRNRRRRRRRRSDATPDAAAEAVGRTRQGADGVSFRSRAADAPSLGVARAHAPPSGFRGANTTLCTAVAATGASPRLGGAGDTRRRPASAPPSGLAPQRARLSRRAAARVLGALPPAVNDLLAATPLWGRRRNREAAPTLAPARITPRSAGVVADGARETLASAAAAVSSPRAGAGAAPCTPPRRATLIRSMKAPHSPPAVALTGAGAACGLPVVGAAVARFRRGGGRKAQPSRRPPLPPPSVPPPDLLLADTVLAAAVPLPGGGQLFRPRPARARAPPPPSLAEVPVVGRAQPRTRAAVAAAAAAAAEARRASLRVPCAASTASRLAHSEPSARAAVTVSDERRNE